MKVAVQRTQFKPSATLAVLLMEQSALVHDADAADLRHLAGTIRKRLSASKESRR